MEYYSANDSEEYVERKLLDTLWKDIVRFLIELITNADDSYSRIEERDELEGRHDFVSWKIYITVNEKKDNNWKKYQEVSVIDFAEWMSKDRIIKIFHDNKYWTYNAWWDDDLWWKWLRGFFWQWLSDVLRRAIKNNKPAQIESICDGMYTIMYYGPGKNGDRYWFQISTEPVFENSDRRRKLWIIKNGTKITFWVPDEVDFWPKVRRWLRDSLEKCPILRYLLDDSSRQIYLWKSIESSEFEGKLSSSKYRFSWKILYNEPWTFPFRWSIKKYHLKIYEKTNPGDEAKIIVRDEYYAVYANTQFKANNFQDFVGELEIPGLRDIVNTELRVYKQEIFKDNRTWFNNDHEFFTNLNSYVGPILAKLNEKVNNDSISSINNKDLKQGLWDLNKYYKDNVEEEKVWWSFAWKEPPASWLKFGIANQSLIMTKGKKCSVRLLINSNIISPQDVINIEIEGNDGNIEVSPLSISYWNKDSNNDTWLVTKNLTISANELTEKPVVITAVCWNFSDKLYVWVINHEIQYPENWLKFSQKEYSSVFDKPHKLKLYFDSNIVPIWSIINVDCWWLIWKSVYKSTEDDMILDSGIWEIDIVLNWWSIWENFTIKAFYWDILTSTDVVLTDSKNQKNPSNWLISGVEFQNFEDGQSWVQISFDSSTWIIYINKNNHINKKFLWDWGDIKLKDDMSNWKPEHKKYFCDLLTDCIAKELVKKVRWFRKKWEVNFTYSEWDIADKIWEVQQKHKNEMFKILYSHLVKSGLNLNR